jgi:hypothetical protein
MNLVRTSFFCIILRSSLKEQNILKHEEEVPDLGEYSGIATVFHKDYCTGGGEEVQSVSLLGGKIIDKLSFECISYIQGDEENESEILKNKPCVDGKKKKKKKFTVCLCWAVRYNSL